MTVVASSVSCPSLFEEVAVCFVGVQGQASTVMLSDHLSELIICPDCRRLHEARVPPQGGVICSPVNGGGSKA